MYQAVFEPISNRADWIGNLQLQNEETGAPITDLAGIEVKMEIRRACCSPFLSATFANGKIIDQGNGVMQWRFTASDMNHVCPDTYDVGIILTRDGITVQELVGSLPVIDGVVRQ